MIREIHCKSILQKSQLPESSYCLNPYVGCTHRCHYCYARFMRRFTGHSEEAWGTFVDVKVNGPEVLARQLERTRIAGSVLLGSVCDAYQPVEKRYSITRACIEQLVKHGVSFSVLTKSDLVLRDMDLLIKGGDKISVGISLALLDDKHRKCFEPGAASVSKRLNALKELHNNGIKTYLFVGPVLPHITDVEAIINAAAPDTDEIWGEVLNLKCGNREDLAEAYSACGLSQEWQQTQRSPEYWQEVEKIFRDQCQALGLPLVGFYKH